MPTEVTHVFGRDSLLNLAGRAIPLLVALASVPATVAVLGVERFGILALIWTVHIYFGAYDVGLGRATTKFVAETLDAKDDRRSADVIWGATAVQLFIGLFLGLITILIARSVATRVLNVPLNLIEETTASLYLLAPVVPILLVLSSLRGALEGALRFDLSNIIKTSSNTAIFLLPLFAGHLGFGLPGIALSLLVGQLVASITAYVFCRQVLPGLRSRPRTTRSTAMQLAAYGGWVTASGLLGPVFAYMDRFVIASVITVASVTYYAVPYDMITRLWAVPASIVSASFPRLGVLDSKQDFVGMESMVRRSLKWIALVVGPITLLASLVPRELLGIWMGSGFAARAADPLRLLGIGVFLSSFAHVPYSLIQARNRPDLITKLQLLEIVPHVWFAWFAITRWGILGAAIAWAVRAGIDAAALFLLAMRMGGLSSASFAAAWRTSMLVVGLGLLALIPLSAIGPSWQRIAWVLLVSIVSIPLVWKIAPK